MSGGQTNHQHQRAPRTPESYFNVPESVALLNIVKSDRIQTAFQSNRKNHASVWEMVADILSRYNNRKRSAKQCCNRYENLKKIYTQLKRNPEKHVRRNWPYMYLFRQIEEQRGESWGSAKRRNELSYYQRRRALMLMNNNSNNNNNGNKDSSSEFIQIGGTTNNNVNKEQSLFIPNQFVQTQIGDCEIAAAETVNANAIATATATEKHNNMREAIEGECSKIGPKSNLNHADRQNFDSFDINLNNVNNANICRNNQNNHINLDNFELSGLMNIKEELPETDYDDDRELLFGRINNNYNGHQSGRNNNESEMENETNILHPDVIVDTDHATDSSTSNSIINVRSKRKISTSSGEESTNYELIEYLKRRERRDEEMLKRMEAREEKLLKLLERTVIAIEQIASRNYNNFNNKPNHI